MGLNLDVVHTYGQLPDGRKGIVAKNPYRLFVGDGIGGIVLQGGIFYRLDGEVIENPRESLPTHVLRSLPKDFWEPKPVERPISKFADDELEAELLRRQVAQEPSKVGEITEAESVEEYPDTGAKSE